MPEQRCARPKKNGEPCQNIVCNGQYGPDACSLHVTEQERDISRRLNEAHQKGHKEGVEWQKQMSAYEISREAQRRVDAELRDRPCKHYRLRDHIGQIVTIGAYAYRWTGKTDLKVGDQVLVPAPYWQPHGRPTVETVTALGSDYQGDLVNIIRVNSFAAS